MATRYVVLPHAREAVRALGEAGDARAGELVTMPDAALERTHELLAAIADANLAAPEPPARWASERRFRSASADTPLVGRIREAALDCLAYRDDVHLAAWSAHADPATEGGLWNAFSHVWAGEARDGRGDRVGSGVPPLRRGVLRACPRHPRSARLARGRRGWRVRHHARGPGPA